MWSLSLLYITTTKNVFIKHYAPNHMPDPKGEWSLKENNSELHHGIHSKVNQFIYTLVCNFMPNIRILTKVVLQIFRSQGCSYTKCLCPENGSNSTENLRNVRRTGVTQPKIYGIGSKLKSVHPHLGLSLYAKYQDPSQSGSSDIFFTRFFIQSRKRGITPE